MSTPIQTLSDDAAAVARSLANSTERAAHQGIDRMAESLDGARSHTSAALKQFAQTNLADGIDTELKLAGFFPVGKLSVHDNPVTLTQLRNFFGNYGVKRNY